MANPDALVNLAGEFGARQPTTFRAKTSIRTARSHIAMRAEVRDPELRSAAPLNGNRRFELLPTYGSPKLMHASALRPCIAPRDVFPFRRLQTSAAALLSPLDPVDSGRRAAGRFARAANRSEACRPGDRAPRCEFGSTPYWPRFVCFSCRDPLARKSSRPFAGSPSLASTRDFPDPVPSIVSSHLL